MSNINIVRAWKDAEYRNSLNEAEKAMLQQNPAGLVELADELLMEIVAAYAPGTCKKKSCSYKATCQPQ